jgi:K+-transporting ATPase A subunit
VAVLVVLLGGVYVPFGNYLAQVFTSERHWRAERWFYRLVRVDPDSEQRWTVYAAGVLGLSFVSVLLLYLVQRLQPLLPLGFGRGVDGDTIPPAMPFNTAVSFVTNTNWQSYVPEATYGPVDHPRPAAHRVRGRDPAGGDGCGAPRRDRGAVRPVPTARGPGRHLRRRSWD